jgi:hypothetical protein
MVPDVDVTAIQGRGSLTATLLVLLETYDGGELPRPGGALNEGIVVSEDRDALEEDGFDRLLKG